MNPHSPNQNAIVELAARGAIGVVTLNDPARRNALGLAMFHALESALDRLSADDSLQVVLLRGEGPAFCSGFDLDAAAADPSPMAHFIERLSGILNHLRRMPQVVVAAVQGAAIAGGCALLSGCDFVVVSAKAELGYPVHRIGVSPAVTISTLMQAVGPGATRSLLMGGEIIDGLLAHRIGLATHLAPTDQAVHAQAEQLCQSLAQKGQEALHATKAWASELDQSLEL